MRALKWLIWLWLVKACQVILYLYVQMSTKHIIWNCSGNWPACHWFGWLLGQTFTHRNPNTSPHQCVSDLSTYSMWQWTEAIDILLEWPSWAACSSFLPLFLELSVLSGAHGNCSFVLYKKTSALTIISTTCIGSHFPMITPIFW